MSSPENLTIRAADGVALSARMYGAAGGARSAVLIVSAMGATQRYYAALATWLAEQGFMVATFDYRGMGDSRRGSLRELRTDIQEWARLDCAAVLEALAERAAGRPLVWLGHSLGGQILPFVPNHSLISRAITIATGSGSWRDNVPALRWRWHVAVPLAVRVFGYFPGRRLGKVGDLPRGVIEQWRRWCLDPKYAVDAEGAAVRERYAAVATPLVSLSFVDDEFLSATSIASLHGSYSGASKVMHRIGPAEAGVGRIGHFGFFRPSVASTLWRTHLLPAVA